MQTYHYTVHRNGPALWPEHKSLTEILKLQATTPSLIWEGTYQGNPTPAGGYVFRRKFWNGKNRYAADGHDLRGLVVARFQSWDTAEEVGESNAWTACVTGEIMRDYRLAIRHMYRARLTFDALPATIESQARQWNGDGLLHGVVIEDKSSGKSAQQTLRVTAPEWLRPLISPYRPVGSKEARAGAAAVWCRNDMVWLPHPGNEVGWLIDFEDELFTFPQGAFADQVDAFSQLVLYSENYLSAGWEAKEGRG
jgi:predicted phage terminase large subunit-like protein